MDYERVGRLIRDLRKEKGMTQRELAERINVSDKAVSKWERGMGCPDVSLLGLLSEILGISAEKLLAGDLDPNDADGGNMKRIKFYVCASCGNTLSATGDAGISCCGRKLTALMPQPPDEGHKIAVALVEEDYYITFDHPMDKQHYYSFAAYVLSDRVLLVKLYPEQGGEVRFPRMRDGKLYLYCTQHGLREHDLNKKSL